MRGHPEEERKDQPDAETACPDRDTPQRTSRTTRNGNDEEEVDEAHEQVVDLSAVVAGDCSHDRPTAVATSDEERHPERRAEPEDDAAQVVAPELVGPEQVPAAQRRPCRMTL